jgi:hypothetical protein
MIPPSLRPGWIVTATAKHGTVYHIAVVPNQDTHTYRVYEIDEVPWKDWMGTRTRGVSYSIYRGDRPAKYDVRRETALGNVKVSESMYRGRDRYMERSRPRSRYDSQRGPRK